MFLAANVTIDEFMASNVSTLPDENGQFHDWIEVRNNEATEVNLQGWRLTDNKNDLSKWVFPSVTLQPGDSILVFSDGIPDANNVREEPFGHAAILSAVKAAPAASPKALIERLLKEVKEPEVSKFA